MPEIRFTEEDHAFAREFVDRLEQSGVAGTVREFLSKEDAEFILFQSERKLRNSALMMRLAEAVISTAVEAGLAESADTREARAAHYAIHYDNFDHFREGEAVCLDRLAASEPRSERWWLGPDGTRRQSDRRHGDANRPDRLAARLTL